MTMPQQSNDDNSHWKDILSRMFGDARFRQFKKFRWYGEVDGMRIGIVVANKGASYNNFALNKADFDDLLAAKRSGKIDLAFVVASTASGGYVAHHDAEEYAERLRDLTPRNGQFGEFWTLTESEITGEEEPF
jgi:hypothetical protein